jgi:hypothetical protein
MQTQQTAQNQEVKKTRDLVAPAERSNGTLGLIGAGPILGSCVAPIWCLERAQPASGIINPNGLFTLMSHSGRQGAEPGPYQVAIRAYTGSFMEGNVRYLVPKRFSSPHGSGLTAQVPENEGDVYLEFNLNE